MKTVLKKNIVIYPHGPFEDNNGGIIVQYFLAYLLDKLGINILIYNEYDNNAKNKIFNKFTTLNKIDSNNTIAIYSEGIVGNPLKTKYVVRWILSKLGQNVPVDFYFTWGKNDLVYFFNSEIELIEKNEIHKMLSVFYFNEKIKKQNFKRNGICYTNRKNHIHVKLDKIHTDDAFEITNKHKHNDYIEIFNKHKIFISYDPLTFLNIIAAMCGCISVVYPIDGVSKKKYLMMTSLYEYLNENNTELYGIAYGTEESELIFAKNTMHLVKKQFEDIQKWFVNKYVVNFISDMNNFDKNNNTVFYYDKISYFKNNSFKNKYVKSEFIDIEFYKKYNTDLKNLTFQELIYHYNEYGKKEGRFPSKNQVKDFVEDENFDIEFYKKYNADLFNLSFQELIHHYKDYGKKEGRFGSEKQIKDFVEDENFDIEFYKKYNTDLSNLTFQEIINHYKKYGKKEGRFGSEKQIKDFVEDKNFDIEFYKKYNTDLSNLTFQEIINHYKKYGKKEGRFASKKQMIDFFGHSDFDIEFYKNYNTDLSNLTFQELIHHYKDYGKEEGRFASEKQMIDFFGHSDFDIEFYKKYNTDLSNLTFQELIHHYKDYGKEEGRFASKKQMFDFFGDSHFDIEFYKKYNKDLSDLTFQELIYHYKYYGKKEGRFGSEKQIKDFVEDENFDIEFYKKYNTDLSNLTFQEIINHYKQYGKKECRFASEKQVIDFLGDPEFDIEFYKNNNPDLNYLSFKELIHYCKNNREVLSSTLNKNILDLHENNSFDINFYMMMYSENLVGLNEIEIIDHYNIYGIKKGYFCSEKNVKDFVNDTEFDIKLYKKYNPDLINMSYHSLVEHYKESDKKNKLISSEKKLREFVENEITYSEINEFQLLSNVCKNETNYFKIINNKINKIKDTGEILHIDKTTNTELYTLYINWFKVITKTKKMVINSPINNELICTDKYFIMCNTENESSKYSVCNYYFEDEKIILGLGLGAGNHPQECYILYVYSFNENKIFYGWLNYPFENFKKNNMIRIIDFICNFKNYNFDDIESNVKTTYGLCNNMGHALFNEYTGLYILNDYDIIKNIDEVIQGPFDVYHISNYFKKFKNININYIKNNSFLNYVIGKGILFKFNHHFITNKCIDFLKKNLYKIYVNESDYKEAKLYSKNIKKNHYPIINIVLRKGDYEMNNQSTIISTLINMILNKYPNAFFYFDGFVSNNYDEKEIFLGINSSQNICNIKNQYIDLVEEIVKKIDTTNYLSLIDKNIYYLIEHIKNCSYSIYTLSSASCNGGWICKIPGIQFGRPSIGLYKWMDKIIREGNLNINYYNDKITYDENGNFNIDAETIFNLLPNF